MLTQLPEEMVQNTDSGHCSEKPEDLSNIYRYVPCIFDIGVAILGPLIFTSDRTLRSHFLYVCMSVRMYVT